MTAVGFRIPVISDVAEGVWDFTTSIFTRIPGSEWIETAVESGATWIGDMAKTVPGKIVLVGISNALVFPAIAGLAVPSASGMIFIGPQVASAAWAIPGVVRGESFSEAYAKELTWRTMAIVEWFGGEEGKKAAAEFTQGVTEILDRPEVKEGLRQFKEAFNLSGEDAQAKLKEAGLDPTSLSNRYGGRGDSAAAATNGMLEKPIWNLNLFDPRTGKYLPDSPLAGTDPRFPFGTDFNKPRLPGTDPRFPFGSGPSAYYPPNSPLPSSPAPQSQPMALTLLDSMADLALLAGFVGGLYLFGRAAWNSRRSKSRRASKR